MGNRRIFLMGAFSAAASAVIAKTAYDMVAGHSRGVADAALPFAPPQPVPPGPPVRFMPDRKSETDQFHKLGEKIPWLENSRKSIGFMSGESADKATAIAGSCILLDRDGTVVFCAHQVMPFPQKVAFSLPGGGYTKPVRLEYLDKIESEDIAFGRIPPELIAAYGLQPIGWAAQSVGGEMVMVGYPGEQIGKLDAEMAQAPRYLDPYKPDNDSRTTAVQCDEDSIGKSSAGDSGGAMFDRETGYLRGMLKATGDDDGPGHFSVLTPVEGVWAAYKKLFPRQAQSAALPEGEPGALPGQACAAFPSQTRPTSRHGLSTLQK